MQTPTQLNGSYTQTNNYIWGAALTLAWKKLIAQIIKQPIKVKSSDKTILTMVQNYNDSPCNFNIMINDCYYAKAGFGNKTVKQINQQVKLKFPQKTTEPIQENLPDDGIISFAYFLKKLTFDKPFDKKKVNFNHKLVSGFMAQTKQQKSQITINQYNDTDNFLIQLKTKQPNDHIYILKSSKTLTPQQVITKLQTTKSQNTHLGFNDIFQMPKIQLKHKRTVKQLLGVFLANQQFQKYYFSEIYQIINLNLDQKGIKVENQGVIQLLRCGMPVENKKFILDKPFWIVMCQQQQFPYLVAHINHIDDKISS